MAAEERLGGRRLYLSDVVRPSTAGGALMWNGRRVSLVLPAYNEGENIGQAVEEFRRVGCIDDILVIDNNSTDGTAAIAAAHGATVIREPRQGYGAALRRGLREAPGELIVLAEPDGTFDARDVTILLRQADRAEMVCGTRTNPAFIEGGANMGWPLRTGNRLVARLLGLVYGGPRMTDCGCTLRLVHRAALQRFVDDLTVDDSHFLPEMVLLAVSRGVRVVECPVRYRRRIGMSKITGQFKRQVTVALAMIRLILRRRQEARATLGLRSGAVIDLTVLLTCLSLAAAGVATLGWGWPVVRWTLYGLEYQFPLQAVSWMLVGTYATFRSWWYQLPFGATVLETAVGFVAVELVIGLTEAWVAGELAQYLAPLALLYYQYAVFYVLSGLFLVVAAIGRWHAGGRRSLRSQTLTGLLLGYLLLRLAYTHHPLAIAWIVMAFIAGRSKFGQQMQEVAQRWWWSPWSSRRDLGVCLVFFLLAWVTREVWAIRVVQSLGDNFPLASDDGVNYHVFALGVSRGEHPTWFYGGLIYWHLLGWLYRVAGPNFFVVTALQALLGATTAPATYLMGRRLAGRGVGMLAATLVSLDANLIFLSIVLGMEAVFLPLMSWFLLAASTALASGRLWRPWWSLALGLVAGLAYMVRVELIGLPAVFAALAWYAWSRHGVPGRMALRASLEFFAGIACGWMALGLANLVYSGEFTFLTMQAPMIFAVGYGGTRTQELAAMGFNPFRDLGAAVQVLFLQPWTVIRTMALSFVEKFVHFFLRPNFGTFDPVLLVLPYGTRMPMYSVLLQWYGGCLVCIGGWLVLRRRIHGIAGQWLGAYVVYTAVVYAAVAAGNARHRGVLLPILWIWLACAIQHAVMAVRRARVTSAVRMMTRRTSSIDAELIPASSP